MSATAFPGSGALLMHAESAEPARCRSLWHGYAQPRDCPPVSIMEGFHGIGIPGIMVALDTGTAIEASIKANLTRRFMLNVPAAGVMVPEERVALQVMHFSNYHSCLQCLLALALCLFLRL